MKHNHHTTPRYYLKGFRIPDQPAYIWQYHRGTPYQPGHRSDRHNPVKRALKKAGTITDYYGTYEDDLEEREACATPIIERLRATPHDTITPLLTQADKAQLTDYIGLLMKRTTARDERTPNIWKTVLAQQHTTLDQMQRDLAYAGRFTDARKIDEIRHEYDAGIPEEIRRRSILMPFDRVRSRIIELRWAFLTTPTPALLTSDNPVRYPEHEGLGHDLAFLTIPWSTTITLFASTHQAAALFTLPSADHDCASRTVTPEQVATLNHLTITGAHQYLYSHRADEDTATSFG